jgi:hypothetical protein
VRVSVRVRVRLEKERLRNGGSGSLVHMEDAISRVVDMRCRPRRPITLCTVK